MTAEPSLGLLLGATAAAALVVGFLRTAIGGGIGVVLTTVLSLVLPAQTVLALVAPLLNVSDPISLRYYWRQWDGRQLRLLLPTTVAGVVVGTWLLSLMAEPVLRKTIGGLAVGFASLQLALFVRQRRLFGVRPHSTVGLTAGLLTGTASTVAHSGGIVLGLYLVNTGLSSVAIVATANALVSVSNIVKLLGYWRLGFLTGPILVAAVVVTPLVVVGAWAGYRAHRHIPRRAFELTIIAISLIGGARLLLRS